MQPWKAPGLPPYVPPRGLKRFYGPLGAKGGYGRQEGCRSRRAAGRRGRGRQAGYAQGPPRLPVPPCGPGDDGRRKGRRPAWVPGVRPLRSGDRKGRTRAGIPRRTWPHLGAENGPGRARPASRPGPSPGTGPGWSSHPTVRPVPDGPHPRCQRWTPSTRGCRRSSRQGPRTAPVMLYTGAVEPDGRWPRREQVTWAVVNSVKVWLSAAGIEHRKVHPLEEPSGRRQGVRGRDLPGTPPPAPDSVRMEFTLEEYHHRRAPSPVCQRQLNSERFRQSKIDPLSANCSAKMSGLALSDSVSGRDCGRCLWY